MSTRLLQRYDAGTRSNHWVVAILFVLAGLSGLAIFHPALFGLSALFGGGVWTRILHPYLGLAMVVFFLGMFFRLWRENVLKASDRAWLDKAGEMLRGDKSGMPPVGKYNAGQKIVFWLMATSLLVLLVTGIVFWYAWFGRVFPIWVVRLGVLLHSLAAVVLILTTIVHVYAAIWVKGTTRAMTRGTVTESWAKANHPLWHAEVTGRQGK
jgi:formate dehydrogenase subunit gamma